LVPVNVMIKTNAYDLLIFVYFKSGWV